MAHTDNKEKTNKKTNVWRVLTGRSQIFAVQNTINAKNVADVVRQAEITHKKNEDEIKYLYEYFKGKQPILCKTKKFREEINYKVVENRANSIVAFKVGYMVGKPIKYISSVSDEETAMNISKLNQYMRAEGKLTKDRKLVEWQMICGTGYRIVLPKKEKGGVPFEMYTLNPMNTFVIYRNDYTEKPLAGVIRTVTPNTNETNYEYTVYTEDRIYHFGDSLKFREESNPLGVIPIIEYPANTARLGAFETVLPILDAVNELSSNRLDAIAQFVESLLVFYNCDFEEGVTAENFKEAGMILMKSVGEQNSDVKFLTETLNQTDNETLKKSLLKAINEIVGVPEQSSTSSGDNNGAVVLKNGWQGAQTRAEDFEAMFEEPERTMLNVVSRICSVANDVEFDSSEIEVKFTRQNDYADLLSRSQTLTTMLSSPYINPRSAYEVCGLFTDVEEAYRLGMDWFEEQKANAEETEDVTEEKEVVDEESGDSKV